jgi:hypothetical protein
MARDRRVVRRDAVGVRGDERRDLEREGLRVRLGPERCAAARILDRQRERQSPVGKRDGVEPVAQLRGLGGDDRRDVGEDLEGVPRRSRLALGRAQVGLEPVAVAAVGVAVGAHGVEGVLGARAREEQLEAPPVEQAGMAGQEPARGSQLLAHRVLGR